MIRTFDVWRCFCPLTGKSPREAVAAFVAPIRDVLRCVTSEPVKVEHSRREGGSSRLFLGWTDEAVLLSRDQDLFLRFTLYFRAVEAKEDSDRGPWNVSTTGYAYALERASTEEILLYHWHPEGGGDVKCPHLHLGNGATPAGCDLRKLRIPTARIEVEDVVRFAITQLGVPWRRDDWEQLVEASQRRL